PATEVRNEGGAVAEIATVAVADGKTSKIEFTLPDARQAPCNAEAGQLNRATIVFRSSVFAEQSQALGWNEISLFGVHGGAYPKERMDAWGLIPLLAWSGLSLKLTKMEADAATVTSPRGSLLRHPRRRANYDLAMPWWAHPALKEGVTA